MALRDLIALTVYEEDDQECWPWEYHTDKDGYGKARDFNFKYTLAHRIAWECRYGPIPSDKEINHKCRYRACWNPNHLELVTPYENKKLAIHTPKTICSKGHSLAPENRKKSGNCKSCARIYQAAWREKNVGYRFGYYRAKGK